MTADGSPRDFLRDQAERNIQMLWNVFEQGLEADVLVTSGGVSVGARLTLVAFNVLLPDMDLASARELVGAR